MAKFCTKCGKSLTEGEVCNCTPVVQPEPNVQPVVAQATSVAVAPQGNSLVNDCINIIKNFFKKPVDTLEENINENKFTNAMVMIVLNGLATGLFVVVLIKEVLGSMMGLLMGGYGSYASLMMGSSYQVEIPYFKYFIIVAIVGIVMQLLLGAAAYLISDKMFKGNTNIKKMITLFGFSSIILTAGLLVASICLFINATLGLIVYLVACILNTYYICKGLEFSCNTDRNKLAYVLVLTYAAVMIVVYLVSAILG